MGTLKPHVQSALLQGFIKTKATLELVGIEMEKGAPEVPRRWSSTSLGDNRTPRCHGTAPWH